MVVARCLFRTQQATQPLDEDAACADVQGRACIHVRCSNVPVRERRQLRQDERQVAEAGGRGRWQRQVAEAGDRG